MNFKCTSPKGVLAALAITTLFLSGCSSLHSFNQQRGTAIGARHQVKNVHQEQALPAHLKRIAVLPLHLGRYDHIDFAAMEENFSMELIQRNLFEVIKITPEEMQKFFSQSSYSAAKPLPSNLLSRLHATYAIDGILLMEVSYFNAYQPIGLGIRATLLDGRAGQIVWTVDEVFDVSDPKVANAAKAFYKNKSLVPHPLQSREMVIHSPHRLSKYVAHAIFNTIPLHNY